MLPELILSIYFAYKNSLIAKAKGQNTILWVILSVMAFLFAEFIGMGFVIGVFYDGPYKPEAMVKFIAASPVRAIFIYFCAIGGCLFVRYILEQMKGKLPPAKEQVENE